MVGYGEIFTSVMTEKIFLGEIFLGEIFLGGVRNFSRSG
jgi:hypothetical protein